MQTLAYHEKLFAGPDDPVTATCWDCGYTWKRGMDGSHSCVQALQIRLRDERARIRQLALDEAARRGIAQDDFYGRELLSAGDREGHKADALRAFAALLEDR